MYWNHLLANQRFHAADELHNFDMWQKSKWEINGNHTLVMWKFGPNSSKLDTTKRLGASSSHPSFCPRPQPNSSLATNDWPCKSMVNLCIIVLKKPFGTIRHSFSLKCHSSWSPMKELRIVGTWFFECKLTCKCKVTRANYHKTNTVQAKHQKARIAVHHLWNGSASRPRRDMRHTMIQCLISSCCGGEPRRVKPSSGEHRLGSGVQMLKLRTSESWIWTLIHSVLNQKLRDFVARPAPPAQSMNATTNERKCQVSTARGRHPTQHQHLLQPSAILKESKDSKVHAAES